MFADSSRRCAVRAGRPSLRLLFAGWVVAEVVAFAFVVKVTGFLGAILLSLAASLIGLTMLRRLGFEATRRVRAALAQGKAPDGVLLDGLLEALAALLLIIPGFVSDLVGLALAAPSARQIVAARFGGSQGPAFAKRPTRNATPDVIDLTPSDWTVVDGPERR